MKKYAGLILSFVVLAVTFLITGCSAEDVPAFFDKVTDAVGGWGGFSLILAGVLEFIMRIFPTFNPKSIFKIVAEIMHSLGRASEAIAKFLDGLGLQNLKK